ncbi:MAG: XRE family transcriptional regulator [Firmicutes bacterium]|nr:XRE family transcriptional regulator [Bacillota bacterium]
MRKARLRANMTILELATVTGFNETTISQLENNKNKPLITTFRLLAEALGVTVAFLGCFENLPEENLSQQIRKSRLFHGFNKKEFAASLRVDTHTIIAWESGTRKPLKRHMKRLSSYLSILNKPL